MKTVMLFGTFDILHYGHIHLFTEARTLGDHIIAVVAQDRTVQTVKGRSPFHTQEERMSFLQQIRLIDAVVLGDATDMYKVIRDMRPDVIALGYDQKVFVDDIERTCMEEGLNTEVVRLSPYRPKQYKTSHIKEYLDQVV